MEVTLLLQRESGGGGVGNKQSFATTTTTKAIYEAMYQMIQQQHLKDKDVVLEVLEVSLEEFESWVRDWRIYNMAEFCYSQEFEVSG